MLLRHLQTGRAHGERSSIVEVFLDGRVSEYTTAYTEGVYQMLWVPPAKAGDIGHIARARDAQGAVAVGKQTAGGYALEFSVPLNKRNFPGFAAKPGAIFGFDIAIDDLDSGMGPTRKTQMVLNGTENNHCDTSGFLRLRFDEE